MEEYEMIEHFFHEHPLRPVPNPDAVSGDYRWKNWCYGCYRFFLPGEVAYGCCTDNCEFGYVLHEECLEMPREIRHPLHPSHTLTQQDLEKAIVDGDTICAVCENCMEWGWGQLGYICIEGCKFWIHLACAGGLELENKVMKTKYHPSHPQHELSYFRTMTSSFSFGCDACGTMEKGNSYICTICDYCIHESCAALPITADFPHHHQQHQLSLAFHTPSDYIIYEYECAICRGALRLRRWVYHCELCSYVAHIKCATNDTSPAASTSTEINTAVDDREDIITIPINDAYEEIIRPFVKSKRAESGEIFIPPAGDKEIINGKFEFQHHHHPLSFVMFSASPSSQDRNEEDSDDDDDLENSRGLSCDGCTMPIHHQKSSSDENGYMSCGECNYFLHLSCFNLPSELPSLPLHSIKDHKLMLRTNKKLGDWSNCDFCDLRTNGLIYACTICPFKVDIKCASLRDTMKHTAHPQDHHYLKLVVDNHSRSYCRAGYGYISKSEKFYACYSCQFAICSKCVWLPSWDKHRLEKHWMPLTYAAYGNHPSEFYCGSCENKMHPKTWMYHCRDCDQSFHPKCFPNTSGKYRNINFGRQQYRVNVSSAHHLPHHPLTFQIITTKKRCNLCHQDVYEEPGFQCASCSFVMCLSLCGRWGPYELKGVNSANE